MRLHGKRAVICGRPPASATSIHVTIPNHDSLKAGTLAGILNDVAAHFKIGRDELIQRFFR
jgi:hypothetical protein